MTRLIDELAERIIQLHGNRMYDIFVYQHSGQAQNLPADTHAYEQEQIVEAAIEKEIFALTREQLAEVIDDSKDHIGDFIDYDLTSGFHEDEYPSTGTGRLFLLRLGHAALFVQLSDLTKATQSD